VAEVETSFATWDRISPGDGAAPESWKLVANLTSLVVQLWLGRSPTNGEDSSVLASEMHPVLLSHDSSLDVEGYNVIKFFRPGSVTQHWLSRVPLLCIVEEPHSWPQRNNKHGGEARVSNFGVDE
jgi:hypothetical protein